MNENISYTISYDQMKEIIKNYYANQGRNVDFKISNKIDTDRFQGMVTTSMQITEKSTIGGVEAESNSYLDMNDLKEIIGTILEQENKELLKLTNNAFSSSRIEGYGMGEHEVKSVTEKSFTITVREKKQTFGKR